MEEIRRAIESLLGGSIVSLHVREAAGDVIVFLTYRDSLSMREVVKAVRDVYPRVIFDELERIYSDDVIRSAYGRLYDDGDYNDYWEVPDVGRKIDMWLENKSIVNGKISNF